MTKEEILKMPAGREMDALVAERVMGWKNVQWDEEVDNLDHYHPSDYYGDPPTGGKGIILHGYYSTCISAAWEVVERLEHNWNLLREVGMCGTTPTEGSMQYRFILAYPNMEMVGVTAETAPLAICRAALLAVMEEKNAT